MKECIHAFQSTTFPFKTGGRMHSNKVDSVNFFIILGNVVLCRYQNYYKHGCVRLLLAVTPSIFFA